MSRSTARPGWPLTTALCLLALACGPDPGAGPGGAGVVDARAAATRAPVVLAPALPFPAEGFGHAVAIAGSAVAVADFLDTDHADVHTYWLDGATAWPTGAVKPADSTERCFGSALAFQWGCLAVGSPCALAGRGEARLYAPAGDGWIEEAALGAQAGATALFGKAVAAGQGRIVVAAPGRAGADPLAPAGRVFVYHLGRGGWVQEAVLAPADTAIGERTARAVAAGSGVVAVAGDPIVAHSLHLFEKVGGAWVEADVEPALRGAADCGFVHALAMDGNLLVVGMPTLTGPAGEYRPGGAWVYKRSSAGWTRLGDVPSAAHPLDKAGHAVAVSRGTAVVGGPGTLEPGVSAGSGEVTIERRWGSAEVADEGLEQGDDGDGRRLGPQRARPERGARGAGRPAGVELGGGEPALRPDHRGDAGRPLQRQRGERRAPLAVEHQQPDPGRQGGQRGGQRGGRRHLRHVGAAALARRLLGDATPALGPLGPLLGFEPHHRPLGGEGDEARRAQLGGLLDHQVHLLPLGEGEEQVDGRAAGGRLAPVGERQRLEPGADARRPGGAAAVEELHLVARGEPQHVAQVVARLGRQLGAVGADPLGREVDAPAHGYGVSSGFSSASSDHSFSRRSPPGNGRRPAAT